VTAQANSLITNLWRYEHAAPLGAFDRPQKRASEYRRDSIFLAIWILCAPSTPLSRASQSADRLSETRKRNSVRSRSSVSGAVLLLPLCPVAVQTPFQRPIKIQTPSQDSCLRNTPEASLIRPFQALDALQTSGPSYNPKTSKP
jgi:hypothetical protein